MVLKITEPMKQFDTNMQVHNINTKSRTDCCPYFWEKCFTVLDIRLFWQTIVK